MSFITSKKCADRFIGTKYICLDVRVSTNHATVEEEFTFSELQALRGQLESVIRDIDYIIDVHKQNQEGE